MSTNIGVNESNKAAYGGYSGPVGGGQPARVADALEVQSRQLGSLSSEERSVYNSYSGQVMDDIDYVEGMSCGGTPMDNISCILAEIEMRQSFLMGMMLVNWFLLEITRQLQLMGLHGEGCKLDKSDSGSDRAEGADGVNSVDGGDNGCEDQPVDDSGEAGRTEGSSEGAAGSGGMTPVQAARIFVTYFDLLDTAAGKGRKDNVVETADFEAVAGSPDAPAELREAAAYIVRNPMMANAMDVGNRRGKVDGRFGLQDFIKFIEQHEGKEGYDAPLEAQADGAYGSEESVETDTSGSVDEAFEAEESDSGSSAEGTDEAADAEDTSGTSEAEVALEKDRLLAIEDARLIRDAVKGGGTDEATLIDILSNRSNRQIELMKRSYQEIYNKDMVADIKGDTSGRFADALVLLLEGKRDESTRVDLVLVRQDSVAIWESRRTLWRLDDTIVTPILMQRSKQHLAQLAESFEQEHGESLVDFVKSRTSGNYESLLLAQLPASGPLGSSASGDLSGSEVAEVTEAPAAAALDEALEAPVAPQDQVLDEASGIEGVGEVSGLEEAGEARATMTLITAVRVFLEHPSSPFSGASGDPSQVYLSIDNFRELSADSTQPLDIRAAAETIVARYERFKENENDGELRDPFEAGLWSMDRLGMAELMTFASTVRG